ncbi:hypothetical protein XAC1170 [Xanthomonas citri pv. citri str. 306]|uniref:Uncharacterized protein n=1 Tax=Xanthomonas axonopodis pv. citri (strain 306) TaxID=190486 RepID=A0AAI7ZDZ5_XANAC|nr:hypothetical protein XAC1170 [Xanthomonas citri pv. citri str. 306]
MQPLATTCQKARNTVCSNCATTCASWRALRSHARRPKSRLGSRPSAWMSWRFVWSYWPSRWGECWTMWSALSSKGRIRCHDVLCPPDLVDVWITAEWTHDRHGYGSTQRCRSNARISAQTARVRAHLAHLFFNPALLDPATTPCVVRRLALACNRGRC